MGLLQSASRRLLGLNMFFLVLLGYSLLYVEAGTGSYVVAQITLIPIVLTTVAAVVIIYTEWSPFE